MLVLSVGIEIVNVFEKICLPCGVAVWMATIQEFQGTNLHSAENIPRITRSINNVGKGM